MTIEADLGKPRRFAQKKHFDPNVVKIAPLDEHMRGPVLLVEKMPVEKSLIPGDNGRLHYAPRFSAAMDEEPKKNKKLPKPSGHHIHGGKKPIPQPIRGQEKPIGKRAIPLMMNKRGTELPSNMLTTSWNNKRVVTQSFDGKGPTMRSKGSDEFAMEVYMNRKQRGYEGKRNPMYDSEVKYTMNRSNEVDRTIPYFIETPNNMNSAYTSGYYKQPVAAKASFISTGGGSGKMMKTYTEIAKEKEAAYDIMQVRLLNNPTEKLGRYVPGWEEKTGLYLVTPEMEKD